MHKSVYYSESKHRLKLYNHCYILALYTIGVWRFLFAVGMLSETCSPLQLQGVSSGFIYHQPSRACTQTSSSAIAHHPLSILPFATSNLTMLYTFTCSELDDDNSYSATRRSHSAQMDKCLLFRANSSSSLCYINTDYTSLHSNPST